MHVSSTSAFATCIATTRRVVNGRERLKAVVESLKTLGAKIVLTQGAYDLVHIGHARYLEAAKNKGDVLIVGVDSDKKIRARKGPERPIVPEAERMEMVLHLRPVDVVVLKKWNDPQWQLIKLVRPDVLVATEDTYTRKEISKLKKYCKEVFVLKRMAMTSTSAKIRNLQIKTANKLVKVLRDALADVESG